MKYDPHIHYPPKGEAWRTGRRSIRLKGYDYSLAGAYFVTIDTWRRESIFGEIIDGNLNLNEYGNIADECWDAIPQHFPNVELDDFIIMPNHMHGILVIMDGDVGATDLVGATHASPLQQSSQQPPFNPRGPKSRSIGSIIGSFKSATTKRVNELRQSPGEPVWQRNYYEHIIRDENELNRIRNYIFDNPRNWMAVP